MFMNGFQTSAGLEPAKSKSETIVNKSQPHCLDSHAEQTESATPHAPHPPTRRSNRILKKLFSGRRFGARDENGQRAAQLPVADALHKLTSNVTEEGPGSCTLSQAPSVGTGSALRTQNRRKANKSGSTFRKLFSLKKRSSSGNGPGEGPQVVETNAAGSGEAERTKAAATSPRSLGSILRKISSLWIVRSEVSATPASAQVDEIDEEERNHVTEPGLNDQRDGANEAKKQAKQFATAFKKLVSFGGRRLEGTAVDSVHSSSCSSYPAVEAIRYADNRVRVKVFSRLRQAMELVAGLWKKRQEDSEPWLPVLAPDEEIPSLPYVETIEESVSRVMIPPELRQRLADEGWVALCVVPGSADASVRTRAEAVDVVDAANAAGAMEEMDSVGAADVKKAGARERRSPNRMSDEVRAMSTEERLMLFEQERALQRMLFVLI